MTDKPNLIPPGREREMIIAHKHGRNDYHRYFSDSFVPMDTPFLSHEPQKAEVETRSAKLYADDDLRVAYVAGFLGEHRRATTGKP